MGKKNPNFDYTSVGGEFVKIKSSELLYEYLIRLADSYDDYKKSVQNIT